MPKLTLTFDTYDERSEMMDAIHGISYAVALTKIDSWLRNLAKYESKTFVSIEDLRQKLREETEGLPIEW